MSSSGSCFLIPFLMYAKLQQYQYLACAPALLSDSTCQSTLFALSGIISLLSTPVLNGSETMSTIRYSKGQTCWSAQEFLWTNTLQDLLYSIPTTIFYAPGTRSQSDLLQLLEENMLPLH